MANYQLRKLPEEIDAIIKEEQGKKLVEKKVLMNKENIIYQIIKEWKKLKNGK